MKYINSALFQLIWSIKKKQKQNQKTLPFYMAVLENLSGRDDTERNSFIILNEQSKFKYSAIH